MNKAQKFLNKNRYPDRLMIRKSSPVVKDFKYVSDVMMEFLEDEIRAKSETDTQEESALQQPGLSMLGLR